MNDSSALQSFPPPDAAVQELTECVRACMLAALARADSTSTSKACEGAAANFQRFWESLGSAPVSGRELFEKVVENLRGENLRGEGDYSCSDGVSEYERAEANRDRAYWEALEAGVRVFIGLSSLAYTKRRKREDEKRAFQEAMKAYQKADRAVWNLVGKGIDQKARAVGGYLHELKSSDPKP